VDLAGDVELAHPTVQAQHQAVGVAGVGPAAGHQDAAAVRGEERRLLPGHVELRLRARRARADVRDRGEHAGRQVADDVLRGPAAGVAEVGEQPPVGRQRGGDLAILVVVRELPEPPLRGDREPAVVGADQPGERTGPRGQVADDVRAADPLGVAVDGGGVRVGPREPGYDAHRGDHQRQHPEHGGADQHLSSPSTHRHIYPHGTGRTGRIPLGGLT
jgi:hypothetical protein